MRPGGVAKTPAGLGASASILAGEGDEVKAPFSGALRTSDRGKAPIETMATWEPLLAVLVAVVGFGMRRAARRMLTTRRRRETVNVAPTPQTDTLAKPASARPAPYRL